MTQSLQTTRITTYHEGFPVQYDKLYTFLVKSEYRCLDAQRMKTTTTVFMVTRRKIGDWDYVHNVVQKF
jgi:hypothetical protein